MTRLLLLLPLLLIAACGGGSTDPEQAPVDVTEQPAEPSAGEVEPPELIGPVGGAGIDGEYSQFNDSPFANLDFTGGYFYLENFEDGVLEFPGASADAGGFTSVFFGPSEHDSVDEDDGLIDGNSLAGDSWINIPDVAGVTWTFNAAQLDDNLPSHVGVVWTDGRGEILFEAFDAAGNSLGVISGNHADESFNGETSDDRFYGVVHQSGISAFTIRSGVEGVRGGIELDHLQWGFRPVSEQTMAQPVDL